MPETHMPRERVRSIDPRVLKAVVMVAVLAVVLDAVEAVSTLEEEHDDETDEAKEDVGGEEEEEVLWRLLGRAGAPGPSAASG